jgi:ABC-type branched-subunit amino acid transport system permease subunit
MIGLVSYLAFFLTMAGIMAIVTLGLNLQWGYTGCSMAVSSRSSAPVLTAQ